MKIIERRYVVKVIVFQGLDIFDSKESKYVEYPFDEEIGALAFLVLVKQYLATGDRSLLPNFVDRHVQIVGADSSVYLRITFEQAISTEYEEKESLE